MSVPAVGGYQPNQFHPKPIHSGPLALNSSPLLPLCPTPGLTSTRVVQELPSGHDAQPLACAPVPSPSQTSTAFGANGASGRSALAACAVCAHCPTTHLH